MGVNLSLRIKLLVLVLAVLGCFGGAISVYVTTRVADDLTRELLKRGESVARHLAETSAEDFIEHDLLHMQYRAREHQAAESDIRYVLMIDRDGALLAHSFGATFPPELVAANRYLSGRDASIQRLDTGSDIVYDIAVPVLDGRVGSLRIGISAAPIHNTVATLVRGLLVAILVLGLLAFAVTLPASQAIARPLSSLTRALEGLGKGGSHPQLPVDRRDEIGVLNEAFNQMAADVRRAEKRLAAEVSFLQVLMEDLPVPVFYKDCNLRMLGCNRIFAEFWGKRIDEILGRSPEELYPPAEAALHRAKDMEVLAGGASVAYEQAIADGQGQLLDIIFHKALFRDENDQPAGLIGVMLDITPQREAARQKNEFVSVVAHEFQTPLATILGFGELLQGDSLDESERREALQTIIAKAEGLSQMVDELLDQARLESGRYLTIVKEPCNLTRLLVESVDSFGKRIDNRRFVTDLPGSPVMIEADGKRISQVVGNLLSNAVKYSEPGSVIHVSASSDGNDSRIVIRDEGCGMSPAQLEHLFDKFYRVPTTARSPRGTGLGMFIVKSIVEAHGGSVRLDSTLGQGTTVTCTLPVA